MENELRCKICGKELTYIGVKIEDYYVYYCPEHGKYLVRLNPYFSTGPFKSWKELRAYFYWPRLKTTNNNKTLFDFV
jgi:hypothetical protein